MKRWRFLSGFNEFCPVHTLRTQVSLSKYGRGAVLRTVRQRTQTVSVMTDVHLMAEMYRVLCSYPCRCQRRWDKETEEGYRITERCSNCVVQERYVKALASKKNNEGVE